MSRHDSHLTAAIRAIVRDSYLVPHVDAVLLSPYAGEETIHLSVYSPPARPVRATIPGYGEARLRDWRPAGEGYVARVYRPRRWWEPGSREEPPTVFLGEWNPWREQDVDETRLRDVLTQSPPPPLRPGAFVAIPPSDPWYNPPPNCDPAGPVQWREAPGGSFVNTNQVEWRDVIWPTVRGVALIEHPHITPGQPLPPALLLTALAAPLFLAGIGPKTVVLAAGSLGLS